MASNSVSSITKDTDEIETLKERIEALEKGTTVEALRAEVAAENLRKHEEYLAKLRNIVS